MTIVAAKQKNKKRERERERVVSEGYMHDIPVFMNITDIG